MKKISLVRTSITSISLTVLAVILALLVWWQQEQLKSTKVVFLNVGQGDAILLQQGRHQVLIDSGKESKQVLSELGRYMPFWDRHIEIIIPTHPDADHIGGFAGLTKTYSVGRVLWTGVESDSAVFALFQKTLEQSVPKDHWFKVAAGTKLHFPKGGKLEMLYPREILSGKAKDEDTNATSIVARFQYGSTSFLLTGDLAEEEKVLGELPPVTVLKAAHHGSKYSTSSVFLEMLQPKDVVVSVGKNSYGHPNPQVLERIERSGARVLRTDQEGSIEYRCQKHHEEQRCVYVGKRRF